MANLFTTPVLFGALVLAAPAAVAQTAAAVAPSTMPRVATVDERFQSYNVEMVEVTGGRFWAPYRKAGQPEPAKASAPAASPGGLDPSLFRYRPPIDLANPRLRKLAAALGPAYVRVSGTWANSTYFHDSEDPAPSTPPPGFGGILTRREWKGVVDFARAADAKLVTSFAVSQGVRDDAGVWTPRQARKLAAFTKAAGGSIAAAELFNEPNFAAMGGAPKGYNAAAYARDFAAFRTFAKQELPYMLILGPGSVGDVGMASSSLSSIKSEDMLAAGAGNVDAFSYHFYGGVSRRCGAMGGSLQTTPEAALSATWLSLTERDAAFYAALRDRYSPAKPLWLTETGETACGGNPWASTFADTFRYLEQLGRLARRQVQVVAHNTLAASDYALLDEETFNPRPDYWAAFLWRRFMGTTVLDPGASPAPALHLFAHCWRNHPGGVAVLAVNTDRQAPQSVTLAAPSERYTMTAPDLTSDTVQLNGVVLKLGPGDTLPQIAGKSVPAGEVQLPPASITFLAVASASNPACR